MYSLLSIDPRSGMEEFNSAPAYSAEKTDVNMHFSPLSVCQHQISLRFIYTWWPIFSVSHSKASPDLPGSPFAFLGRKNLSVYSLWKVMYYLLYHARSHPVFRQSVFCAIGKQAVNRNGRSLRAMSHRASSGHSRCYSSILSYPSSLSSTVASASPWNDPLELLFSPLMAQLSLTTPLHHSNVS